MRGAKRTKQSIPCSCGEMDCFASLAMTSNSRCAPVFSRRDASEVYVHFDPLEEKRAQGRPGARCTRGLVCKVHKRKSTRAYRFSGGNPAFPAQRKIKMHMEL